MDLFDLLAPLITPEIEALARERIVSGGNLATRRDLSPKQIKVALLIVAKLSPETFLKRAEAAIIHGISYNTLSVRYRGGSHVSHPLNIGK